MHRRSHSSRVLILFDPEIESTFWPLQRRVQSQSKEGRQFQEVNMDPATTPLRDFAMPDSNFIPSSIVRPPIDAGNFKFHPRHITFFNKINLEGTP